jgi:hypothetical protein
MLAQHLQALFMRYAALAGFHLPVLCSENKGTFTLKFMTQ